MLKKHANKRANHKKRLIMGQESINNRARACADVSALPCSTVMTGRLNAAAAAAAGPLIQEPLLMQSNQFQNEVEGRREDVAVMMLIPSTGSYLLLPATPWGLWVGSSSRSS